MLTLNKWATKMRLCKTDVVGITRAGSLLCTQMILLGLEMCQAQLEK